MLDFNGTLIDVNILLYESVKVLVTQSCPTLCDPMDCSSPGSSVHGILQARILEWVAVPSSRGSSQPRDGTQVSMPPAVAGTFFTTLPPWLPVLSMQSGVSVLLFMVQIRVHTHTQNHTPQCVYPFLW